jgi:hypothetical protein
MIIHDLDFKRITITPNKTNAILIVNTDAVLALSISLQCFQLIARKDCEIAQLISGVYLHEFSVGDSRNLLKTSELLPFEYSLGGLSSKGPNHRLTLLTTVRAVKHKCLLKKLRRRD